MCLYIKNPFLKMPAAIFFVIKHCITRLVQNKTQTPIKVQCFGFRLTVRVSRMVHIRNVYIKVSSVFIFFTRKQKDFSHNNRKHSSLLIKRIKKGSGSLVAPKIVWKKAGTVFQQVIDTNWIKMVQHGAKLSRQQDYKNTRASRKYLALGMNLV